MKRTRDVQMSLSGNGRALWTAWAGWAALFLVTAVIIIAGSNRTVVPAYREGAVSWIAGEIIYKHPGVGGFVYLPQAAVLFIPFSVFPVVVGEVLWRFVNIGVFALGIRSLARLTGEKAGTMLFPLMTLVTIPLAWDCARNGQATLIITGLMLLATVDLARARWWRATLWLSLGVAIKPLVIVMALLVMAIDRPLSWRLLLGMLAMALFPFAAQHPAYVLEQYAAFWSSLTKAAHVGVVEKGWTTSFNALELAGVHLTERIQTGIRAIAAVATLVLSYYARRRFDAVSSAVFVLSLAVLYLMLFSPRTENNTYAMLGPVIALFLAQAFVTNVRQGEGILLVVIAVAMMSSRPIEHLLTPNERTSWVAPLMAAGFAVYLLVRLFSDPAKLYDGTGET